MNHEQLLIITISKLLLIFSHFTHTAVSYRSVRETVLTS